jgi:hypothetical protein
MRATSREGKKGLPAVLMLTAMGVALSMAVSAASVRANDPPTCDGLMCSSQWHCGSKCVCNPYHFVCLDNTEEE